MSDPTPQQQLAAALTGEVTSPSAAGAGSFTALVNALPPYGNQNWAASLITLFADMVAIAMPDTQPTWDYVAAGFPYPIEYVGPATYAEAFYPGFGPSAATEQVATATAAAGLTFWRDYGTALNSQAALNCNPGWAGQENASQIAADLTAFDQTLHPHLQVCVAASLQYVFSPTSVVYTTIANAGSAADTLVQLAAAMQGENFRAIFNEMVNGDDADAATWFLYLLWNTADSLGSSDVDDLITTVLKSGLDVPGEIGPGTWSNGGYVGWHNPLSGRDLPAVAIAAMTSMSLWNLQDPDGDWIPYGHNPSYGEMYLYLGKYWHP